MAQLFSFQSKWNKNRALINYLKKAKSNHILDYDHTKQITLFTRGEENLYS
jgi:hypothetical protein